MMKHILLKTATCLLFVFNLSAGAGDSSVFKSQYLFNIENDVFTSLFRDQYYSSGLFFGYSWLHYMDSKQKNIRSVTLAQRIYTPRYVTYRKVESYDRPYAGHLSIQLNSNYYRTDRVWKHQLEFGWMGPGSMTGTIQETWHGWFGLPEPRGWKNQIPNSPIINYNGLMAYQFVKAKGIELISESHLAAGTAFNFIREEVMVRTGLLKNLLSSVQYNGQLGDINPKIRSEYAEEIVLFYAPGIEYNFYNSTIEGNIIGQTPIHTETPVRWILQHRIGLFFSWKGFDFTVNYYRRSKETTEATPHPYVGVQFARRF